MIPPRRYVDDGKKASRNGGGGNCRARRVSDRTKIGKRRSLHRRTRGNWLHFRVRRCTTPGRPPDANTADATPAPGKNTRKVYQDSAASRSGPAILSLFRPSISRTSCRSRFHGTNIAAFARSELLSLSCSAPSASSTRMTSSINHSPSIDYTVALDAVAVESRSVFSMFILPFSVQDKI